MHHEVGLGGLFSAVRSSGSREVGASADQTAAQGKAETAEEKSDRSEPSEGRVDAGPAFSDEQTALDPLSRSLWSLAPPDQRIIEHAPATAPLPGALATTLDDILARMVTRFALSGDKRRGTSHLVVGAGELAGGSITLEAEGKAVHVRIDAPPGVDARAFGESIRARLEAKGLEPTIELR